MKIANLQLWRLHIPFKLAFKHASAERSVTESIWVEARDSEDCVGYGEGCPRSYVSGETLESCAAFFRRWRNELVRRIQSVDDLRKWVAEHRGAIDAAPAAWCAIELAVLDLFARRDAVTLEALLDLPPIAQPFEYTAILGDQGEESFRLQFDKYRAWGFSSWKIKLGDDRRANDAKIGILREAGISAGQIRVDANNLWRTSGEAGRGLEGLASSIFAVEEPLSPGDLEGMRRIADQNSIRIILDESFLREEHFGPLKPDPSRWLINLRVSKMGGLIRSLEIARRASAEGIGLIVGAQVGETSLLTRAALTVAHDARKNVKAQEGAFGTHLLQHDVVNPSLTFGSRGRLGLADARPLEILRPTTFLRGGIAA